MNFQVKSLGMALIAAFGLTVSAIAAPLPPGSVLFGPSTETDPTGGSSVATLSAPFTVAGAFSGTLTTDVISGDTSNPFGGLTFVYTITNDGVAGPNSIGRLSLSEFAAFSADGSYQIPLAVGAVAPASIDRNPSGDVVGFNFVPVASDPATGFLAPGATSAKIVIQTDATAYVTGAFASVIDGGVGTVSAIVPVPEPSTVVLSLVGLAGAALFARRRG